MEELGQAPMFVMLLVLLMSLISGISLFGLSISRPRLVLYLILALTPTQYLFIPVSDFFISPADVLAVVAGAGLLVRLLAGKRRSWNALWQHKYLGLMVLAYIAGFVVSGLFSRTLIRVVLAIIPSILAWELLRTRKHLMKAATALIISGIIDVGYGVVYYANGIWLHPTCFSGMSGVNFTATLAMSAAVIGFAQTARTRQPVKLLVPGLLTGFGLATLSQMGVLAFFSAWLTVLWRVASKANRLRLALTGLLLVVLVVVLVLSSGVIRERLKYRRGSEILLDGVARSTAVVRLIILRTAWRGIRENPVFGIGYYRFLEYSNTDPEINAATGGQGLYTHNVYAEILVEGGLLAFVPFVMHFVQYARSYKLVARAVRNRDVVVAASLAALPVVFISAALANILVHYSFWAVCGLGSACVNLLRVESRDTLVKQEITRSAP